MRSADEVFAKVMDLLYPYAREHYGVCKWFQGEYMTTSLISNI
jgi:hypothetical protein